MLADLLLAAKQEDKAFRDCSFIALVQFDDKTPINAGITFFKCGTIWYSSKLLANSSNANKILSLTLSILVPLSIACNSIGITLSCNLLISGWQNFDVYPNANAADSLISVLFLLNPYI